MKKTKIQMLADALISHRAMMAPLQADLKTLKLGEEKMREEMLAELKRSRFEAFRTDEGVMFTRAYRTSYEVSDAPKALKWALENGCAKVDTTRLTGLLKGTPVVPEGIEYKSTEYLTIRSDKETEI